MQCMESKQHTRELMERAGECHIVFCARASIQTRASGPSAHRGQHPCAYWRALPSAVICAFFARSKSDISLRSQASPPSCDARSNTNFDGPQDAATYAVRTLQPIQAYQVLVCLLRPR